MYCKLPCIVSDIKGHKDLIASGHSGYLCSDVLQMAGCILQTYQSASLRTRLGINAADDTEQYKLNEVQPVIMQVYKENM